MDHLHRKQPSNEQVQIFKRLILHKGNSADKISNIRLVEDFECGNIFFNKFGLIEMCFTHEFYGIDVNDKSERHKKRNSISSDLRKEGFNYTALGYSKF